MPVASSQIPNGMCGPFAFEKEKKKGKKGSRTTLSCCPLVKAKTNLFLSFKIISEGLNFQLMTIACCSSYSVQVSHRELIVTYIPTTILISTKDIKTPSSKNIRRVRYISPSFRCLECHLNVHLTDSYLVPIYHQ